MNAAIISGFLVGLAGSITQNAWYYWRRKPLRWLAWAEIAAGAGLLTWGADMAHQRIAAVVLLGAFLLAVGGTLAFVAFMAEVRHQGWIPVVKRMNGRGKNPS